MPATNSRVFEPFATGIDSAGNLYICQYDGKFRRVDGRGIITTYAGTNKGGYAGDGGPALLAQFRAPHHLLVAPNDDLLIADTLNHRVRLLSRATGLVTTLAGTGSNAFGGDGGPAPQAYFRGIYSIDYSGDRKTLFVCDLGNRRIRAIDLVAGTVRTVAGNGQKGVPGDGSNALEVPLVDPRAVCCDSKGNVYIVERGGHALRVVTPDGKIRTVVGTGKAGKGVEDGPALSATLNGPKCAVAEPGGDILIADTENHVIRRYRPSTGLLTRVAGTGKPGDTLDPDPLKTELRRPHGVYVHRDGSLYIADSSNHRVLKISP